MTEKSGDYVRKSQSLTQKNEMDKMDNMDNMDTTKFNLAD